MRFHQRFLSGWLLLVILMSSHPAAARLSERKTGFLGRTTELTVVVQSVMRDWRRPDAHSPGGLTFICEEGSGDVHMYLMLLSYRLKNSNQGSCHSAGVTFEFDSQPPLIQSWLRPPGHTFGTLVTTYNSSQDSSCRSVLLMSPLQLLDLVASATRLEATISDVDYISEGPTKVTDSPVLHFDLEPVRAELIELQRRCRKKK